jgi:tRNA-dihydrouridine synthase B
MAQITEIIYQAPLQGFTDFTYRKVFHDVYGGVAKYFIPYISYGKGKEIKKSQLKEILQENNKALPAVPQVLFSNATELFELVTMLIDNGYYEINLNLGCPYPMATNRGRGAAWLEKPAALNETLQQLFGKAFQTKFSVKMRAGMKNNQDALAVFEILNQFPLEEIIFHPRTADQMYDGKADPSLFAEVVPLVKHPLVYNGDIFSETDFQELKAILPDQHCWMTGRGLLMDPSLPLRLNGEEIDQKLRKQKLKEFHDRLIHEYSERLQGSGHLLIKMNQFWSYFSESFENPHKSMKLVKKAGSLIKYNAAVAEIFR